MHILMICNKPPYPSIDGGTLAMASMLDCMLHLGHQVTVFCFSTHKHPFDIKQVPIEVANRIKIHFSELNTKISVTGVIKNLAGSRSYQLERFFDTETQSDLINVLTANQFDLVQFESLYTLPYLATVKKHTIAKTVYRAHNIEYRIWDRLALEIANPAKQTYLILQAKRLKKKEISYVNQVDGITPISTLDEEWITTKLAKPIFIKTLPFALDFEKYLSATDNHKEKTSLFHIGAMDWIPNQKGLMWFLEKVWPALHQHFPDLQFRIAGKNMPPNIYKFASDHVIIEGEVENAVKFMNDNSILVVPLWSGSGLRIKILEAVALKKTVISTSIGAEAIAPTILEGIKIADTKQEFIDQIGEVLSKPRYYEESNEALNHEVRKYYSMKNIAGLLDSFYKRIISS